MKKNMKIFNIQTEKSSFLFLRNNTYSFFCLRDLNKIEICNLIQSKYSVKVKKVNVLNLKKNIKKRSSKKKTICVKKVYLSLENGFSLPESGIEL